MEIHLNLSQKQQLSQQMIQSVQILQMSAAELEAYLEKLSAENPVIELSERENRPDSTEQMDLQRKLDWLSSTDRQNMVYYQGDTDREDPENNWRDQRAEEETLEEYLNAQLLLSPYTKDELSVIHYIINALDANGYFRESLAETASLFGISEEEAERLLNCVKELDPAGVGAVDLRDCLLLQLKRRKPRCPLAEAIVSEHLEKVAKNHLPEVARQLNKPLPEVLDACEVIRSLNPRPGNAFSNRELLAYVSPDAVVVTLENRLEILINEYQYPPFTISRTYLEMEKETQDPTARKYLKDKISEANNVSQSIRQRSSTLASVLRVIVEVQKDFFLLGPGHRHPLKLQEIASQVRLAESTVSRALHSKHVQCRWGIYPLNYFLMGSVSNDSSEDKTAEQVKAAIRSIIDSEDKQKPLSDGGILKLLEAQDIRISRRTVNKYRQEMQIPDKAGRRCFDRGQN